MFSSRIKILLITAAALLGCAAVFSFAPYNINRLLVKPLVYPINMIQEPRPPYELGIVLGAGAIPPGSLGDIGKERVDYALELAEREHVPLLFSGGETPYGIESEIMAQYARDHGYVGQVILERRSTSTYENATLSNEIVSTLPFEHRTVVIITSPYHSRRAYRVFRKVMPQQMLFISYPAETVVLQDSVIGRWKGLYDISREYAANVWYAVRYR